MALIKLHLCAKVREAWTDFGSVGVGRRSGLGKIDKFSQALVDPHLDPAGPSKSALRPVSTGR